MTTNTPTINPVLVGNFELFVETCSSPLNVISFKGQEAISKLYSFDVRVTCPDNLLASSIDPTAPASPHLRSRALLKIPSQTGARFVRGIVASITPEGEDSTGLGADHHQFWRIRIVPLLWMAKHRIRSRIFQQMSVVQIVTEILSGQEYAALGVVVAAQGLQQDHPVREYCMQYRESDYRFIRRILSEEGIFWYFDHGTEEGVSDASGNIDRFVQDSSGVDWTAKDFAWQPVGATDADGNALPSSNAERIVLLDSATYPRLDFDPTDGDHDPETLYLPKLLADATPTEPHNLASFVLAHSVKPNTFLLRDYDYENPRLDVTASASRDPGAPGPAPGTEFVNDEDAKEKWWTWDSTSRGTETRGPDGQHTRASSSGALISGQSEATLATAADAAAQSQLRVYEHHCPLGPDRVDETRARDRLEAYRRNAARAAGSGYCRHLVPGYRFKLETEAAYTSLDQMYVLTKVEHEGVDLGVAVKLAKQSQLDNILSTPSPNPILIIPPSPIIPPAERNNRQNPYNNFGVNS